MNNPVILSQLYRPITLLSSTLCRPRIYLSASSSIPVFRYHTSTHYNHHSFTPPRMSLLHQPYSAGSSLLSQTRVLLLQQQQQDQNPLRTNPMVRLSSSSSEKKQEDDEKDKQMADKKLSLVQRFKQAYAIYGKVVIIIHGLTSCMWFVGAYAFASTGINLLDLFEAANFPDWASKPLRMGGGSVNTWATTLILYKLVAPLRYGLTLLLTRYAVRYLRAAGKAPKLTDRDRLRNLAQESAKLSGDRFKSRLSKGRKRAMAMSKRAQRSFISKYRR